MVKNSFSNLRVLFAFRPTPRLARMLKLRRIKRRYKSGENFKTMNPNIVFDLPDPAQLEIWKKMSFEEKYEVFCSLQHQARDMKRAMFKLQFPDLTDEEIDQKVVKFFLYATT